MDQKIEIFCCYAHEDQNLLEKLKISLAPLQNQGLISYIWSDTNINPGTDWEKEIHRHLNTAQVILLLVSPDFLASNYCYSVELTQVMKRHEKEQIQVIPVILRPTHLKGAPFVNLQMLPTGARPITSWKDPDDAFLDIVQGVEGAVEALVKRANERKRLRQEQARMISLFGYETDGGTKSALWTDPMHPELEEKKFQQWRSTKRAFTEEEIAGHVWIKIASSGHISIVRFSEKDVRTLKESFLDDPGEQWDGSWMLIDGMLRINIDIYELDIVANSGSECSIHSGIEFMQNQAMPDAYFTLLPLQQQEVKHWPLGDVPALVERIFEQTLERSTNQQELIAYGSLLHRGEMSVRDLMKVLGLSKEHRERFIDPETADEALGFCYKHFLGRMIDSGGRANYSKEVKIRGFSWFINDIIDSNEYKNDQFGEDKIPPDAITCLSAVSMYPGHLECFYRGSNNSLWHRWWYGPEVGGTGEWSEEHDLGGLLASAPAAISTKPHHIDCFYQGRNNHLWHRHWDGEKKIWSDEEDLGGILTSAPTVTSRETNRLCFYRGQDNGLWYRWWDGTWGKEERLGGTSASALAVISRRSDRINCFYRGKNNHLCQHYWTGKYWYRDDRGGILTSAPTVASWGPTRLDCFYRGQSNGLRHLWWNDDSQWSREENLGGYLTSAPTAVSWGPNRIDCFYLSKGNLLWHHWWDGEHWNQEDLGGIQS